MTRITLYDVQSTGQREAHVEMNRPRIGEHQQDPRSLRTRVGTLTTLTYRMNRGEHQQDPRSLRTRVGPLTTLTYKMNRGEHQQDPRSLRTRVGPLPTLTYKDEQAENRRTSTGSEITKDPCQTSDDLDLQG